MFGYTRSMTLRAKKGEDLMTTDPVSIDEALTLREALAFLIDKGISGAPVIDDAGRPVGTMGNQAGHDSRRPPAPPTRVGTPRSTP